MSKIATRIKRLEAALKKARQDQDFERSCLDFQCACGKMHQIRECAVVQTHWYTSPHGCTGGDYWSEGELHIVCPETKTRNRVMFNNSYYRVKYELRDKYAYNAEMQFVRMFKHLFKKVISEHDNTCRGDFNNNYFDNNHEKFGITIPEYEKD